MSSSYIIIVARNVETGEIELPLGDMTLYGLGEEKELLEKIARSYDNRWTISLYGSIGKDIVGQCMIWRR